MNFHSDPTCDSPSETYCGTFFPDGFLEEGCVEGYGALFLIILAKDETVQHERIIKIELVVFLDH